METEKVQLLEALFHDKLDPFTTMRVEKRNKETCTYVEITLKFQHNHEIDHAIAQLQQLP